MGPIRSMYPHPLGRSMQSQAQAQQPPQLFHLKELHEYRRSPGRENLRAGMIVYATVGIKQAVTETARSRYGDLLIHNEFGPYTVSRFSRPASTTARSAMPTGTWGSGYLPHQKVKPRPCVVLFVDRPTSNEVILAPITGRDGYHLDHETRGSQDTLTRQMCFPIPDTVTHLTMSRIVGEGLVWQDPADIPFWKWRPLGEKVNDSPQYLAIGAPVSCKIKKLKGFAWECFYLTPAWTYWCQRTSMDFMSDDEIRTLKLNEEWKKIQKEYSDNVDVD